MLIKDSFLLHAPQERVWNTVQDIPRVGGCVPGVEGVVQTGENTYRGTLKIKIGPISAAFGGTVKLLEQKAPDKLVAEIEGEDKSSASRVKATFSGTLTTADGGTRIDYEVDLALRGKLGQFGGTVVQATAKKMTAEFARRLDELLSEPDPSD